MLSKSNTWDNPFINKATIFHFVGKKDDKIILSICGREHSENFEVKFADVLFRQSAYAIPSNEKNEALVPGYGATIDFYQGHEVKILMLFISHIVRDLFIGEEIFC
jgi:hypothetical protein